MDVLICFEGNYPRLLLELRLNFHRLARLDDETLTLWFFLQSAPSMALRRTPEGLPGCV